jgi:hypothetical protein
LNCANLFLLYTTCPSALIHLLRVVPGTTISNELSRFDDAIEAFVATLCRVDLQKLSARARKTFKRRIQLDTCNGGLGLPSLHTIAPLALVGSAALIARPIFDRSLLYPGDTFINGSLPPHTPLDVFPEVNAHIAGDKVLDNLAPDHEYRRWTIDTFAERGPIHKMQNLLTKSSRKKRLDNFLDFLRTDTSNASKQLQADFLSQCAPEASCFLTAIPAQNKHLLLYDETFRVVLRLYMGLPAYDYIAELPNGTKLKCKLCKPGAPGIPQNHQKTAIMLTDADVTYHTQTCRSCVEHGPQTLRTRRHYRLRDTVHAVLRETCHKAIREIDHEPSMNKFAEPVAPVQQAAAGPQAGIGNAQPAAPIEVPDDNDADRHKVQKGRADLLIVFRHTPPGKDHTHLLDFTVSHPRPNEHLPALKKAATEPGATNNVNFAKKTSFYQSRWSLHHGVRLLPCPFETGGRWHDGFKEFFGLCFHKSYRDKEYRSAAQNRAKQSIAIALRRSVATQHIEAMDQFANRYEIIHPANAAAPALMAVQAGIVFGALNQP